MRVIERKTKGGSLVGYLLELDAGLNAIVPETSLYDEGIVSDLLEAGYKYYDYHGNIKSPDGVCVKDLASSEVDESNQEDADAMLLYNDFQSLYTEQEMQKYFQFDVENINKVEFREPINVICRTRQELMEYLERFSQDNKQVLSFIDLLPINALCDKEALFTLQERIDNSKEFQNAMRLIEKRRVFRDKYQLLRLLDGCADMGIIEKKDEYTDADVLEVYTAWGIEGLNVNVVEKKLHFDVISSILETGVNTGTIETLAEHIGIIKTKTANELALLDDYIKARTVINVPMNKDGDIFVDGVKYSSSEIISKSTGTIIIDEKQKTNLVVANRKSMSSDKPYTLFVRDSKTGVNHNLKVSRYEGRPMMDMIIMSDSGAMYRYKMDYRLSVIVDGKSVVCMMYSPLVQDTIGRKFDTRTVLKHDYQLSLMMYQIAYELVKSKAVKPLYPSTMEMLLDSGITFEGAMDYCAVSNCVPSNGDISYQPYTSVSRTFRKWFPEWFISIFIDDVTQIEEIANPQTDDARYNALYTLYYKIKEKLNDNSWDVLIFCNPMWTTLKGKVFDDDNFIYKRCSLELGWSPNEIRSRMFEEASEHYLEKIDIIINLFESSVLHQGIGRKQDNAMISNITNSLCDVIQSIFKAEGYTDTTEDFIEFKDKLLSNKFFDIDNYIPMIANEAEGCLKDKALFYGSMFSQTENIAVNIKGRSVPTPATGIVIVDTVFKEYSLAPSEERRDIVVSGLRFKLYNDIIRKVEPTQLCLISENMVSSIIDQFIKYIRENDLGFLRTKIMDIYCRNATVDCLKMIILVLLNKNRDKWEIDENGNHVIIRKNFPISIYFNKTIDVKYVINSKDWEYLTKYAVNDASRVAVSLWEYAYGYYSFAGDKMSWNDIIINANVTPWRVTPKKGWNNFTVYNGALNLIPNDTWVQSFRNQGYFTPINNKGGRAPFDLINLIMSGTQCNIESNTDINAIYKMSAYAKSKGLPPTTSMNPDIADFYIDEDAGFEPIVDYKVRYITHMRNAPKGKILYHDVLMSDKYFGLFARFYGEEVSMVPTYVDATKTVPHMFINMCNEDCSKRSFAPYTIYSKERNILLDASVRTGVSIKRAREMEMSIDLICKSKDYIYGNFNPSYETILIYPVLTVITEEGSKEYDLIKLTMLDLQYMAQEGICYQIDNTKFYIKAITGDYIIEV